MLSYIASRLAVAALMVLLATLVIFLIANMVPGDPVLTQLGDIAANNPEMVAAFRHRWGLDLPLWDRYWLFLVGLFHGDLGVSIASQRPVLEDIEQYGPATLELSTIAFMLSLLIGLPLGVLASGSRRRRSGWRSSCWPSSMAGWTGRRGLGKSAPAHSRRPRLPGSC
jgi:peptide/nickel transport system permease protein